MSATRTAERESTQPPRATYQDVLDAPAHQVAEVIEGTLYTHPRPAPRHITASSRLTIEIGGPFDRGRGGPRRMADPRRAGAAPRRGHPGPGPRGLAPGADAGAPRDRVLHARTGLDMRSPLRINTQTRPAAQAPDLRPAKGSPTCGSSTRWTAPSRPSSCTTGSGCSLRAHRTTSR